MNVFIKALRKVAYLTHSHELVYRILRSFIRHNSPQPPYSEDCISASLQLLYQHHPDVCNSALTSNTINPLVDLHIIVPVYNVERYIIECIESVLSQRTPYSYLITIVNDGSPDRSRELLRQYEGHSQIEIIDQANQGFSGARNRALREIKGRYVTFLDSDDTLPPDAIHSLMDAAFKYDADIVQGGFNRMDENSRIIETIQESPRLTTTQDDRFLQGFLWAKVYKAALFKNIHFPEGYWFEDSICTYLIHPLAHTKCVIDTVVYNYRRNLQSISFTSQGNFKCLDTLYITRALLKDAQTYGYTRNESFYRRQFLEINCNFNRIHSLGRPQIDRAAFVIHCALIEQYFKGLSLSNDSFFLHELERAIRQHNYPLYYLANIFFFPLSSS